MPKNYSNAANAYEDFELIPQGTLANAVLEVKASQDGDIERTNDKGNKGILVIATITEGKYKNRKVATYINTENSNEVAQKLGDSQVKAILENLGATPNNAASYNVNCFSMFTGAIAAIEVTVSPDRNGDDRNGFDVLSPLKDGQKNSLYIKLQQQSNGQSASAAPVPAPIADTSTNFDDEIPF